jgi:hypothetical protein
VLQCPEGLVVVRYRVDVVATGSTDQGNSHGHHYQYHDDERDSPHPVYSTANRPTGVERAVRHPTGGWGPVARRSRMAHLDGGDGGQSPVDREMGPGDE